MRTATLLAAAAALAFAAPARADTVCEWMDFAERIERAASPPADAVPLPDHAHAQTQAALAMFEALNAIDRRYQSYLGLPAASPSASQEAAAATAAYRVLVTHFPGQKTALEESYTLAMSAVADAAAREAGRAAGEQAAALALKAGNIDPAVAQKPYRPRTSPGTWVPTALPVFQPWSTAFKPWILKSADAVRPAPPPALTSERYARDFDEVKRLGGKASMARSPHQTLMARYRITPDMMPAMRQVTDGVQQQRVAKLALAQQLEVTRQQGFQRGVSAPAADHQLAHVADVEQAGGLAGPQMLGHNAFVLDRHLVAGERHHPAAARAVPAVQRKRLQLKVHHVGHAKLPASSSDRLPALHIRTPVCRSGLRASPLRRTGRITPSAADGHAAAKHFPDCPGAAVLDA